MSTDLGDTPELTAVREMRADVAGPTEGQREAARARLRATQAERAAGSRTAGPARPPARRVTLVAVAAVALLVAALAVAPVVLRDQGLPPATTTSATTSAATTSATVEPDPTPYATGRVWQAEGPGDRERMDRLRRENVERLPDGRLRLRMPPAYDAQAFTRALNEEGIPIRTWSGSLPGSGAVSSWQMRPAAEIDPERGLIPTSEAPTGPVPFDRAEVVATYRSGPGTQVLTLTFPSVPTQPFDVTYLADVRGG